MPGSRILRARVRCSQNPSNSENAPRSDYKPGVLDDLFLGFFLRKMVEEAGWDSQKPGYDGLIEVANWLMMKEKGNSETEKAALSCTSVTIIVSPILARAFSNANSTHRRGKVAAMMVARATTLSCQWLIGPCAVNSVDLPDGSTCSSGVLITFQHLCFVERCRYLKESKCVGICINTCKLPTQFKFEVPALLPAEDKSPVKPCLEICPNANRRKERSANANVDMCLKVQTPLM